MPSAAVVGTGLIGRSWAVVFACAGWTVRLTDPHGPTLDAAPALVHQSLSELAAHGLVDDADAAASHVTVAASLPEAVEAADLVQENGPETLEAKRAIYRDLDRLAPPTAVLASSTSFIPASAFTEELAGRARCLVGHPVNPPHLVPVVELCGAPWTSPETLDRARALYAAAGQSPVTINREVAGFALNRLQAVLLAEAFRLVGEGVVSPQDLDTTISDGLGLRWSFMGPFETIELNAPGGIADYCARYTGAMAAIAAEPATPDAFAPATVEKILAAWPEPLGPERIRTKAEWRNARLAALAAHKRRQAAFK